MRHLIGKQLWLDKSSRPCPSSIVPHDGTFFEGLNFVTMAIPAP